MWPLKEDLSIQLQTWISWGTSLKPINVFIATGAITKTDTLATTFHNTAKEANMYVRFGYVALKIWYHSQGQVSGSLCTDPINMIHRSKQKTYGLKEELEGD